MNRISLPNLLIVSGTGSRSGKTTMVCRLIKILKNEVIAVKITPHFHPLTDGITEIMNGEGYSVREESDASSNKDTSRMLAAGASRVFLILAWDAPVKDVFVEFAGMLPTGSPLICESQSLVDFIEPGLFILMNSDRSDRRAGLESLAKYPHLAYNLEDIEKEDLSRVGFKDGKWMVKGYRFKNKD